MKKEIILCIMIIVSGLNCQSMISQSNVSLNYLAGKNIVYKIKPSDTDQTIKNGNNAHLVMYDESMTKGKLFLFLPGTHGVPERGPKALFRLRMILIVQKNSGIRECLELILHL